MNTVLLETKQDYIDYCKANDVLNTSQKCGSQYTNIDGGIEHDLYDAIDVEPDSICICRKYITSEPMSYPCIFVWTCIDSGINHDLYDAIDIEPDSLFIRRKYITSEPISYPCIFVWTCIDGDNPEYRGEFIYPQDFEYMKRYGNK